MDVLVFLVDCGVYGEPLSVTTMRETVRSKQQRAEQLLFYL
jgi:hypothetical protein